MARAVELGGSRGRPAWDTPYGRMAVLADNQGAVFAVVSSSGAHGLSRASSAARSALTGVVHRHPAPAVDGMSRAAVRSAVPRAQRPLVGQADQQDRARRSRRRSTSRRDWRRRSPAGTARAAPRAPPSPITATPSVEPTCRLVDATAGGDASLRSRHPGHRGVRDRRVHHAEPDARTPRSWPAGNRTWRSGWSAASASAPPAVVRDARHDQRQPRSRVQPTMPAGQRREAARSSPPSAACTGRRAAARSPRTSCRYRVLRSRKPPSAANAQMAITDGAGERGAAEEPQVDQRLGAPRLVDRPGRSAPPLRCRSSRGSCRTPSPRLGPR